MRLGVGTSHPLTRVMPWQLECCQTLEERHLCAWSDRSILRDRFTIDLGTILSRIDQTQVCVINGARIIDLPSLQRECARALETSVASSRLSDDLGLVSALRVRPIIAGHPVHRRYIFWTDAHVLLRHDPALFGRAVDAVMGVAGESEYADDDMLFLQRLILVGRPSLDVYAEDPRGQLSRWYSERGEEPLWKIVTGLATPAVARWRIGDEVQSD